MIRFRNLDRPRVLIVALAGIGNVLMQSPLWRALKKENPSAEITILVAPRGTKEILEKNPDVKNILEGTPKPMLREWLKIIRKIRQGNFDIGIVTYPGQLIASSSLLRFGNVPVRIGHCYTYLFLKKTVLFLTNPVAEREVHDVVQNLQLLTPLGISVNPKDARYVFPLTEENIRKAQEFLEENNLLSTPLIGIHPGTHTDLQYKRWPIKYWIKLADKLGESYGAAILIFGGSDEKHLKGLISQSLKTKNIIVTFPLRDTAALIRSCKFFVSNDSGLMHVATSQEVPTFGLFGPTNEGRTAPWGPHGHVIRAVNTKPSYNVTRLKKLRRQQETDPTLLALRPEEVLAEITKILPLDETK